MYVFVYVYVYVYVCVCMCVIVCVSLAVVHHAALHFFVHSPPHSALCHPSLSPCVGNHTPNAQPSRAHPHRCNGSIRDSCCGSASRASSGATRRRWEGSRWHEAAR